MDDSTQDEELLMRYIDGELPQAVVQELEKRLESDTALKEKLLQLQVAVTAIKHASTAERVSSIHHEMMSELKNKALNRVTPVRKLVRVTLSVAASILILFVIAAGWWMMQLSPREIQEERYVDFTLSTTRSMDETSSQIGELYIEKKYNNLITLAQKSRLSELDSLLVALSYYKIGNADHSIDWLTAIEKRKGQYYPDAQYYLGFSYLEEKNYALAYQYFRLIHDDKQHLYHPQVPGRLLREVWALKLR